MILADGLAPTPRLSRAAAQLRAAPPCPGHPGPPRSELLPRNGNSRWEPVDGFPITAASSAASTGAAPGHRLHRPAGRHRPRTTPSPPSSPSPYRAERPPRAAPACPEREPWRRQGTGRGDADGSAERGRGRRRAAGSGGGAPRSGDWRRPRPVI